MTARLDDDATRHALATALAAKLGADRVVIADATRMTGGAIQDNWRIAAEVSGGPLHGAHTWVVRADAPSRLNLGLDRVAEAAVLSAASAAGVKVAHVVAEIGRADVPDLDAVVQTALPGSADARRIVRDPDLATFGPPLAAELAAELGRIHTVRPATTGLSCLPVPLEPPARAGVARLRKALDTAGEPRPALEYCLAWLDDHAPPAADLALVHGDFRTGNYLVEGHRLIGILDWEFAHWGDPDEDLGWLTARCWRFGNDALPVGGISHLEPFLAAYAASAGRTVSPDRLRYWQIYAAARWATIAVLQGDRYRLSGEDSIELALTGLMPSELEYDALSDILAWIKQTAVTPHGKGGPTWR